MTVLPPGAKTEKFTPQDFAETASEAQVARAVCQWALFHFHGAKGAFCHVPNEGKRGYGTAADLKSQGLIPGAADYVFTWMGGSGWIELKSPKAFKKKQHGLSDNQRAFRDECGASGVHYAVCCSLEQVQATLREWGAI